jgi:hypothetical protein
MPDPSGIVGRWFTDFSARDIRRAVIHRVIQQTKLSKETLSKIRYIPRRAQLAQAG